MKTLTIRFLVVLSIILMFTGAYFYFYAITGCPAYPGVLEECIGKKQFIAALIFIIGVVGAFVSILELRNTLAEKTQMPTEKASPAKAKKAAK